MTGSQLDHGGRTGKPVQHLPLEGLGYRPITEVHDIRRRCLRHRLPAYGLKVMRHRVHDAAHRIDDEGKVFIIERDAVCVPKGLGVTRRAGSQHGFSRGLERFMRQQDSLAMARLHAIESGATLWRYGCRVENDMRHRAVERRHDTRNHQAAGRMSDDDERWLKLGALYVGDDGADFVFDGERTQIVRPIPPAGKVHREGSCAHEWRQPIPETTRRAAAMYEDIGGHKPATLLPSREEHRCASA